jgi:glycosyltransferase involved in cell wall biosynthesis
MCLVLWSGNVGGAETWTAALARALRQRGVEASVLFLGAEQPLATELDDAGIPWSAMHLSRGSRVLLHTRRFAAMATEIGCDAAILPAIGYLPRSLRLGGYRGRVVSIEHGSLLQMEKSPFQDRLSRLADILSGWGVSDALVAPSDFMLRHLRKYSRAQRYKRIYPGMQVRALERTGRDPASTEIIVGCAARLIPGKGVDVLVRAITCCKNHRLQVRVAGDGPIRAQLEQLAVDLGIQDRVTFLGFVRNMPDFWSGCDIAVAPSHGLIESFGMSAAEAMAWGVPVIASRQGGLQEIVVDGVTGALFSAGDWQSLALILDAYAADEGLRQRHGRAALVRCRIRFDIQRSASEIEELVRSLAVGQN